MKQIAILLFILVTTVTSAQTTIWCEDFESYSTHPTQTGSDNNLPVGADWTSTATDCDDGPAPMASMNNTGQVYWGTEGTGDNEFLCNDIEGSACCGNGGTPFGNNITTETFSISGYTNVTITTDYRHTGTMESGSGSVCNNSDDAIEFAYDIGSGYVVFHTVNGSTGSPGTATVAGLSGTNMAIRIRFGNKANSEYYYIDDICVEGTDNPLPVEYIDFTATTNNEVVNLAWTTANEFNNDHFEVQRSADGVHYETIEYVEGSGTTNTINRYTAEDESPITGTSYYRLKQVDYDNTPSFSDVRAIEFSGPDLAIGNWYWNHSGLHVTTYAKEEATLQLLDAMGRVVMEVMPENGEHTFEPDELQPGLYVLLLTNGKIRVTQKVVLY